MEHKIENIPQGVLTILRGVVKREGGYVNDPDDSGGPTKFGITLKTAKAWGIDVNKDGVTDIKDIVLLTEEQAVVLYARKIYFGNKVDYLIPPLRESVVDFIIHSGRYRAVRTLQSTYNQIIGRAVNAKAKIKADGQIGNKTARSIHQLCILPEERDIFISAYAIARREYLFRIAQRRPKDRKYCVTRRGYMGGWITRCEKFMLPKYRLTRKEFLERIAGWEK